MQNNVCSDRFWYGCLSNNKKDNFIYKIHEILWCDEIINSLISIFNLFISTVQEMFRWKLQRLKIPYLPYFLSDLHQIITVLFKIFYSFYWIYLNLDWSLFPFKYPYCRSYPDQISVNAVFTCTQVCIIPWLDSSVHVPKYIVSCWLLQSFALNL